MTYRGALSPSKLVLGSPITLCGITCINTQTYFLQPYHKVPHCLEGTINLNRWHWLACWDMANSALLILFQVLGHPTLAHGVADQKAQFADCYGLLNRTNSLTWIPLHSYSMNECSAALRNEDDSLTWLMSLSPLVVTYSQATGCSQVAVESHAKKSTVP